MDKEQLQYFERSLTRFKFLIVILLIMIVSLCAAIITQQYLFLMNLKAVTEANSTRIESTIEEIGTLREENSILHTHINYIEDYLGKLTNQIDSSESTESNSGDTDASDLDFTPPDTSSETSGSVTFPQSLHNILILGTHQSLTDTIMMASVNPEKKTVSLVSIPRDLQVKGRKINEIYTFYGAEYLIDALAEVTGLQADEYVVVNMQGFIDVIDLIGGVNIYNEKAIVDYQYPTYNKGYTVYSLAEGEHHLDGQQALRYARSRKSTSDFDRAARQQQIVSQVAAKVKQLNLTDVNKIKEMYSVATDNIDTNINFWTGLSYYTTYRSFSIETGHVIDTQELLYGSRNLRGQFVLLPTDQNFNSVQSNIYNIIVN